MSKEILNNSERKLSLEQTGLSKRWPSWLFAVSIILLFLLIPLASLTSDSLSNMLRNSPLPSDNAWISGTLSTPHQIPELNQNCQSCHTTLFKKVEDKSCLNCHADSQRHIDIAMHSDAHQEVRCASCHREHNRPVNLVRRDDKLCVGCHLNLNESAQHAGLQTELRDVGGFGAEFRDAGRSAPHPGFKISILAAERLSGEILWLPKRTDLAANPIERSNLKFPHDIHMDEAGVDGPDGNVQLACNDCHVNDDAGKLMQPITMENNCRTCHSLAFDPDAPDRVVPHGKPDRVVLVLEEYYARQFLRNNLGREPSPQELREFVLRRPGKTVQRRIEQQLKLSAPWTKAQSVAEEIFTRTTCKTCHEISQLETPQLDAGSGSRSDQAESKITWHVAPVKLTKQWMPKSDFNHFKHRATDCGVCHAARESELASDVLLPDLALCESCHTDVSSHANKTPSSCISCHDFHRAELDAWNANSSTPTD